MPKSNIDRSNRAIPGEGSPRSPSARPVGGLGEYQQLLSLLDSLPRGRPLGLDEVLALRRAVPTPDKTARAALVDRFLVPPFSVLDARQGYWQRRKRMWLELGIQSELGRGETPATSARVGPDDEATYRPIGGRKQADNGPLGFSEQARLHHRANATPGGSLLPATSLKDGKTQRGDGRGRPIAKTFGSGGPGDLAAGFNGESRRSGAHPIPGGGTGKNSTEDGYRSLKDIQTASADGLAGEETTPAQGGTSIFDPVLCELAYRWFCPPCGTVLDPFAGGSVRGIVAAKLGRGYAGVDLRPEQAEANYLQAEELCPDADLHWAVGDSQGIAELLPGEYDFVFSCPPYAGLERYSDDPRDLSTMDYEKFLHVYRTIIVRSCEMLKEDRFACFVVGDIRDRATGNYRGFVGDTIEAFRAAGLELYNEAVLVTAVGSLPIRVGKQFAGYRKLGKTHQNVLVFLKGDAGRAAAACGEVDLDDLEMPECRLGAVAMCAQDTVDLVAQGCVDGDGSEVPVIDLPTVEACLLADVLRGEARASDRPIPRTWVGTEDGWRRLQDTEELSYIVGGAPYLNHDLFPGAARPTSLPPRAQRIQ